MQHRTNEVTLAKTVAAAHVVGVVQDPRLRGYAAELDQQLGGVVSRLMASGEFTGKPLELLPLFAASGLAAPLTLLVGLGPQDRFDAAAAYRAAGAAARYLSDKKRASIAFWWDAPVEPHLAEGLVVGSTSGCHGQDRYKESKARHPFETCLWPPHFAPYLASASKVAEAVQQARQLVNEPPQFLDPAAFAARAEQIARNDPLEIEVWDESRLEQERCGALLAVGRGSQRPPRLVLLAYRGRGPLSPSEGYDLALVGKGVTFDSGGLSLKPTDSMKNMKCDMAGAATVLAALQAIAALQLPVDVLGVMGLVENMPGSRAFKLGDILLSRQGTTIEVLNTDAEGRLVLADALDVAVERGARKIVDLATLTGACVVALGTEVAGLMTNDTDFLGQVERAAERCGERAWQLPMFEEYDEHIKSDVADIKNIGDGRWAGAISAAKLLQRFVGQKPWVHLDIAGPAFLESAKPWQDAGGTGAFVRTLVDLARAQTIS